MMMKKETITACANITSTMAPTTRAIVLLMFLNVYFPRESNAAFIVSPQLRVFAAGSTTRQHHHMLPPLHHHPEWIHEHTVTTMQQSKDWLSQSSSLLLLADIDGTSSASSVLDAIQSEEQPLQYLFMLPTVTMVAICCQLAGIGGAALLSPIFLLIFPLLGPSYPLPTAASAIASALLTEVFGFASGLTGYARRGLVDWRIVLQFVVLSIPSALLGALVASEVASNPTLLRGIYAVLMVGLALYLTLSERPEAILAEECDVEDIKGDAVLQTIAADGTPYTYLPPKQGDINGAVATTAGSALTGLLGVGVGEVVLPQLVRGCCMPLPVAAGTSVAVVVMTALTAALVQFLSLANQVVSPEQTSLLQGLIQVIPWSLVQFTIPGAVLGGQVAPFLASRQYFSDEEIEQFAAILFGIVGIAFGIKCVMG